MEKLLHNKNMDVITKGTQTEFEATILKRKNSVEAASKNEIKKKNYFTQMDSMANLSLSPRDNVKDPFDDSCLNYLDEGIQASIVEVNAEEHANARPNQNFNIPRLPAQKFTNHPSTDISVSLNVLKVYFKRKK